MSFVIGGRVSLVVDDGPFAGVEVEVDIISAYPAYAMALTRAAAVSAADAVTRRVKALSELYEFVEQQARPVWNLVDPRGPIPPTAAGMLRVPVSLMLLIVDLWTESFQEPETPDDDAE